MQSPSLWNACKQHAMGCHFHPLGFTFCNNFAHAFKCHCFVLSSLVLLWCLWSSNYLNTTSMHVNSMVEQLLYLDFVHSPDHKVDKGVLVLLLSSFNIGCHRTVPRFKVCVFPQMFANTLLWSWSIMYLVKFLKALLLGVQLVQKYLVEI